MKFVCPTSYLLLVETWATRPPAEVGGYLQQVVLNEKANERMRSVALRADACAKDKKFLASVIAGVESPSLRSIALRELTNLDDKLGAKTAEGVLALYDSGKPMSPLNQKGDSSVVTAMEILYTLKKLKVDMLKPATMRALGDFVYDKPDVTAEGMKPFHFSPPILETIAWMLGALGDKAGVPLLKNIITSKDVPVAHGEAIRALRYFPGEPTLTLLGQVLEDESNGWDRYNAYLSLKALTGQDFFADWIYGSKDERKEATQKYKDLAKKK
jgi:hypothetical protein